MYKYPLAVSSWDDAEIKAIQKVLEDGITTMWDKVRAFESEFAAYTGSKYCVMVNSGSSANLLAVAALFYRKNNRLKVGDEVIVPAVSWPTTYYPLYQYGLKLKFVDIDLKTLNYDMDALSKAVNENTKIIMAVNLLGNPNNFDQINKIIGARDIILLEDNCESMGALFNGKQTGAFGIIGTFSSFFSHHISTMEGGMIVTDDEELYHIMLSLRAHGWTRNLPKENKVCSTKSDDKFEEYFRFVLPGYNVRPVEMMGAIGTEQLKKLPGFVKTRRENAAYFCEIFKDSPYFIIQEETGLSSWFGFSLVIKEGTGLDRKKIVNSLIEKGIDSRPIVAGNFTKNEVLKWFNYELSGEMKNAEYIDKNGFFVGNHQFDIKENIDYLKKVLDESVNAVKLAEV
ncbi:MAG TPA: DegT/DnrJ/EryC1/StrS family aminotransferase [Candidatus Gastranaerophilales bacterium]|nr:DegT/DnrJ/EryC1/StrS family aminotransferase [Candidatus Gastranaerophilales bacterium]